MSDLVNGDWVRKTALDNATHAEYCASGHGPNSEYSVGRFCILPITVSTSLPAADPGNSPWDDVDGINLRMRCDIGGFLDSVDSPLQLGLQALRRSCFGGNCRNTGCTKRGYIPFTYKRSPPFPIPDPPKVCADPLVKTPVNLPYILPGGAAIGDILDFELDAALKNCKILDTDGTSESTAAKGFCCSSI